MRITSLTTISAPTPTRSPQAGSLDYSTDANSSYYYIYLNAGDASASGAANPGDTIVVQSDGDTSLQTIGTNDLNIDALAGSNGLNLLLGSGVTMITLADYAPGEGANVDVTGNGEGDTIIGNDGNDVLDPGDASGPSTLTGGAGMDTFVFGTGYGSVTITNFDQGDGGTFNPGQGDTIDLAGETNVHSFSDIQSDAISVDANGDADPNGPDTLINFGNGDTLTLDNVTPSQLVAGDFTFTSPQAYPTITITVQTSNGFDFDTEDPIAEMGSGTIQTGDESSASFTIVDAAADREFILDGTNLTYGNDDTTVTGGTITSFQVLTYGEGTPVPLANFTGFTANASTWIADVQQFATGTTGPFNALTANYSFDVIGGSGNDVIDFATNSGGTVTLTGGAGSDTFVYGQGYGAVTITDFDQGDTPGTFNLGEGDQLVLNGGLTDHPTFTEVGNNLVVNFGGGDVLTLDNMTYAQSQEIIVINNGNNNGPTINGAGNTVDYTGTPVTLDNNLTISDPTTITGLTATISSGAHSGDTLTINGTTSGTLTNSDGTIAYNFHNDVMTLSVASGAPTIGDFVGAERDIQYSSSNSNPTAGVADPTRTVTWEVTDSNDNSSSPVTTMIDVAVPLPAPGTASLWGTVSYPSPVASGERFTSLSAAFNGSLGTGLLLYGETADYNPTGLSTVNEYALTVDPFLLPYQDGAPTPTASSLSLAAPFKYTRHFGEQDRRDRILRNRERARHGQPGRHDLPSCSHRPEWARQSSHGWNANGDREQSERGGRDSLYTVRDYERRCVELRCRLGSVR